MYEDEIDRPISWLLRADIVLTLAVLAAPYAFAAVAGVALAVLVTLAVRP